MRHEKVLTLKVLTKKSYCWKVLKVVKIGLRVVLRARRSCHIIENIALDKVTRSGLVRLG